MTEYILEITGLFKYFGSARVIDNVNASVEKGKILAIIGPNGAGKTTLFNLIFNLIAKEREQKVTVKTLTPGGIRQQVKIIRPRIVYRPNSRAIDITWKKPHEIARLGLGRTFQGNRVFNNMSVLENVMLARQLSAIENPLAILNPSQQKLLDQLGQTGPLQYHSPQPRDLEQFLRAEAEYWLDFVGLSDGQDRKAEDLSYGQQKLLSIARLLMADSRLLLFDEPTAGVNPRYADKIAEVFQQIVQGGDRTILFIEHDMKFIQRLGCKCLYMENGRCPWEFYELEVIMKNPEIRQKFLGM